VGYGAETMRSNSQTLVLGFDPEEEAPTARAAYSAVWSRLQALRTEAFDSPYLAVFAVHQSGTVREALLSADQFLVIGRHARCQLTLDDPGVSLRHLVAHWSDRPSDGQAGGPVVRLWDLRTAQPFVTEDGQRTSSVVADGVLFATLGSWQLLFLPLAGSSAGRMAEGEDAAWARLPKRRFALARFARERPRSRDHTLDSIVTHTLLPGVFGDEVVAEAAALGAIAVESPGGRTERRVSADQLDRGLLFGRYERCQLAVEGDGWLSRVHLFVVRIDGRLWAIDTASTNGTTRNGAPMRASLLAGPAMLLLGRHCIVHWSG